METWNIRAACIFFFFLLVSQRLGSSCASIQEQERAPMGFGKSITESSSHSGASFSFDGKLLPPSHKGNKLSGGRAPESQKPSEDLSDGGIQSCRKFLTKTIRGVIQRRLLDPDHSSNKSTDHESGTKKLPHWAIYTIAISGAVLLVVIAGTTMYLLFDRRKKDRTVTPWSTGLSGPLRKAFVAGVPSLGRAELQTACEGFINVIGSSADCTLYKGTLSSGVEIAVVSTSVNSAKDWSDKSEKQFKNKISLLSRVNHKNFMNLLGYCTCDEPFTRMMVLEYAPCGSLFEHLHIREAEDLDWPTRLRIIMGVAYCLEHMSQLDPPVMPTTLSSSSIYLTEDYAAKISDIEFCKDDKDAADESQESIVYKFGVLLLEVISGRVPFSEDHGLLVLWASSYLHGKRALNGMVDPTLRSSVPDRDVAALCDVVRRCIDPEREKRAAMADVARMMRGVTAMSPEHATPRNNPLWWAELEIASAAE